MKAQVTSFFTRKKTINTNNRFYPNYIKPYKNEPTRDKFDIIREEATGSGVISRTLFNKGDLLFKFKGDTLSYQTLYTLQKKRGKYIHDPHFMGKILHSCNPNAICDMRTQEFYATKTILPGEYITMDYNSTEEELFRAFDCKCGSENCRGKIAGYKYINLPITIDRELIINKTSHFND